MVKIAIDAGHGLRTAGKRTPDDEREWSFNNKVVLAAIAKLNTYENVQILRLDDTTGKTDVPLRERTNKANAWGADVLVSCHHNAHMGKWGNHGGVETITQTVSQQASVDIAKEIHSRVVKAMGLRDRGLKTMNLHMTRESKMPAVLVEGGFMDSTTDIVVMRDDAKLKAQGVAIAEGLAAYFKLGVVEQVSKPKPTPKPTGLAVDGYWGPATTRALQAYFKTPIDGVISGQYRNASTLNIPSVKFGTSGSLLVKAMQRWLGVTQDGYLGPITVKALQRKLGTPQDGLISKPSTVVKELQRRLNKGKL